MHDIRVYTWARISLPSYPLYRASKSLLVPFPPVSHRQSNVSRLLKRNTNDTPRSREWKRERSIVSRPRTQHAFFSSPLFFSFRLFFSFFFFNDRIVFEEGTFSSSRRTRGIVTLRDLSPVLLARVRRRVAVDIESWRETFRYNTARTWRGNLCTMKYAGGNAGITNEPPTPGSSVAGFAFYVTFVRVF